MLKQGQNIGDGADLLIGDEDVGVGQLGDGMLLVRGHVEGDKATVKLHTLGILFFHLDAPALFDRDHTVFANLFHHFGDHVADLAVSGGNRGYLRDLFSTFDRPAHRLDLGNSGLDAKFQPPAQNHRIRARRQILQALSDDGMGQDGGRGGAVAGDIIGLGRGLFQQLRAHVFEGIGQFDVTRDSHAIVGDCWSAELLVQHNIAPFGAERHLNRIGQRIHAALERIARLFIKLQTFCHETNSYLCT